MQRDPNAPRAPDPFHFSTLTPEALQILQQAEQKISEKQPDPIVLIAYDQKDSWRRL